ncbi:MAG: HAD hydrolase-like protein [Clostridiaceae bacterium]|jgi:HAD superfamily phosphatase (TIGR01668 family)|nr:HAD hydrolase-like protein [Clostridiaceae bacterium]
MLFCFRNLKPDQVTGLISEFPLGDLRNLGYRFALLDLDNTIAPDRADHPTDYSREVIGLLSDAGFLSCLVSNAKSSRSSEFAQALGIPYVNYAGKPSPRGVIKAMKMLGASAENTVLFGDQIFTDILAANRAGIYSVLVKPYSKREIFYVRLKRFFEYIVRKICRF